MTDKIDHHQEAFEMKENERDTSVKRRKPKIPSKINVHFLGSKSEEAYERLKNIVKLMIVEDIKKELAKENKEDRDSY